MAYRKSLLGPPIVNGSLVGHGKLKTDDKSSSTQMEAAAKSDEIADVYPTSFSKGSAKKPVSLRESEK